MPEGDKSGVLRDSGKKIRKVTILAILARTRLREQSFGRFYHPFHCWSPLFRVAKVRFWSQKWILNGWEQG